jgi:flavoprotein
MIKCFRVFQKCFKVFQSVSVKQALSVSGETVVKQYEHFNNESFNPRNEGVSFQKVKQ